MRAPRTPSRPTVRLLLGLLVAASAACGGGAERPRHVLLVVVDTLRAGHLSCYGYGRPTSPHIDRLAASGVRFAHAVSQSSWTAPSMVSLFSGHHVLDERLSLPTELPTLAELFRAGGYRTGAFVVNPILNNAENGFRRGFDRFESEADFFEIGAWIASNADRPTFTWVHWVDPHDPYGPAPEYEHFMKIGGKLPAELESYYREVTREEGLEDLEGTREKVERAIDGYDDDVRLVDSKVDILLRALEAAGIRDRSVVVLASDHGEGLWTHRNYPVAEPEPGPRTILTTHKMTHGNQLYEELVHVPLILSAPGVPAGVVVDRPVENADLFPTLLELCDLPVPPGGTGTSLLGLLSGAGEDARPPFAVSSTRWVHALVTEDGWKLIVPTAAGREAGLQPELYRLETDPHERENLAAERPDLVRELGERLEARLGVGLRADGDAALSEANLEAMRELGYVE